MYYSNVYEYLKTELEGGNQIFTANCYIFIDKKRLAIETDVR